METKREKFIRVAENRTNRILKDLELLGNCSNKSNYEYSHEDVKKIFSAIDDALRTAKGRYKIRESGKKFKL